MKYLIIILAIALLSCEKETPYIEYELRVRVENTLKVGESGVVPQGYFYAYKENNKFIEVRKEHVGSAFTMAWNTYQPLYIMAATENDCDIMITVFREGIDDYNKPYKKVRGYKNALIDIK